MVKTVSIPEAYASFDDILDIIESTKEPVLVQEEGKTIAIFISPEEFAQMREFGERNADYGPDKTIPDGTEPVEDSRPEPFEQR